MKCFTLVSLLALLVVVTSPAAYAQAPTPVYVKAFVDKNQNYAFDAGDSMITGKFEVIVWRFVRGQTPSAVDRRYTNAASVAIVNVPVAGTYYIVPQADDWCSFAGLVDGATLVEGSVILVPMQTCK